jgi:hypothetical protein
MRKILIPIGLGFLIIAFASAKKVFKIDDILQKLKVVPENIADIDINWVRIAAKIKLNIFNNTEFDLNINSLGLITIEKLLVFTNNGDQVAIAVVNQEQISIPANGAWLTNWIPVEIELNNALTMLTGTMDFNNYQYKLAINVAGFGKYTIG